MARGLIVSTALTPIRACDFWGHSSNLINTISVEEERAAAQSKASNEDVNLVRLDPGRAARSKGFGLRVKVWSGLAWFLSFPLECISFCWLSNQAEALRANPAGADAPEVDRELARHRHDRFLARGPGGERAFAQ